jgi:two-component system osmolarity sensor histidine kinase EnvZ
MKLPAPVQGLFSWRLVGFFLLSWLGSLLLFRAVLGAKVDQSQIERAANILSHNIGLSELALESYPPTAVSRFNGYRLLVAQTPVPSPQTVDSALHHQAAVLRSLLCQRLGHCPDLLPQQNPQRGMWIRLSSPLEPVWLFFPLPRVSLLSTDPLLLSLSLISGSVMAAGLFLFLDVRRPIGILAKAMGQVSSGVDGEPAPELGAPEVRLLSQHFNAMLARLQASDRERQTMLAGIAHDLNSPLTRLRLRLSVDEPAQAEISLNPLAVEKVAADLDALERITHQFLLFAGSGTSEAFVEVPLDSLLAELCARYDGQPLELALEPLQALVQPIAIGRAIGNLIDNALDYGKPPIALKLARLDDERYVIAVIDAGSGIPEPLWARALEPFQRLDPARRGEGHCGLGLAIAQRIAQAHGGQLRLSSRSQGEGSGLCASFLGQLTPPLATPA